MKRIITLTAAMALLAGAGLASAADLPGSLKDSNNTVISPIQGLYGEVAVGYGYSQGQTVGFASAGADLAATGTLFNMRAGFDKINLAGKFGAGIYAEGSNAFNVSGGISGLGRLSEHWSYGSGVKGFYDYGSGQTYILAGWEGTDVSVPGGTKHLDGVMWGVGVNTKIAKNAYAKIEFNQTYYGTINWTTPATGTSLASYSLTDVDNRILFGVGFTGLPF
jgi:hypothetical protein